MPKVNKKLHKLKTLANIQNLNIIREKLESLDFTENETNYTKTIHLDADQSIHKLTQILPKNPDKPDLEAIKNRIQSQDLEGYIISTNILDDVLKQHPLPISAQKQSIIEHICRMNSGPHNQAEGINIVYQVDHEFEPLINQQIQASLPPNLSSQIISTLHRNRNSSLTIGESKSLDSQQKPDGEAILQISHLTYHALDLDLSLEVHQESLGQRQKLKGEVSILENCISLPYSIRNRSYSDHGFILYLKGNNITPKKIVDIIGLQNTGFGGTIIASGSIYSSLLKLQKSKLFGLKKKNEFQYHTSQKDHEVLGAFTFEPNLNFSKNGYCNLEKLGHLKSVSGEVVLAFFPYFQTFIGEYK